MEENNKMETGKEVVEIYVFRLIESQSRLNDVDLLIQFAIREPGDSLLLKMMKCQQFKAVEKWAAFLAKPTLCLLVQEYINQKLVQPAYDVIKKYNLRNEFPELYLQGEVPRLKFIRITVLYMIATHRRSKQKKVSGR